VRSVYDTPTSKGQYLLTSVQALNPLFLEGKVRGLLRLPSMLFSRNDWLT